MHFSTLQKYIFVKLNEILESFALGSCTPTMQHILGEDHKALLEKNNKKWHILRAEDTFFYTAVDFDSPV